MLTQTTTRSKIQNNNRLSYYDVILRRLLKYLEELTTQILSIPLMAINVSMDKSFSLESKAFKRI